MALPENVLINPNSYGGKRSEASNFRKLAMRLEQRMDALEAMFEAQRQQAIDVAKLAAKVDALEERARITSDAMNHMEQRYAALSAKPKKKPAKKYDPMDDKDESVEERPFPGQG